MWYLIGGFIVGVAIGWLLDLTLTREDIRSLREASEGKDAEIARLESALAAVETRSPAATSTRLTRVAEGPVATAAEVMALSTPVPDTVAPIEEEWLDPLTGRVVEAYCVKCHAKRRIVGPRRVSLSNNRPAVKGTCPVCRSALFRIVKS